MSDSGLFIEDLPETVTGRPAGIATIQAEGDDSPTTMTVGEESEEEG